MAWQYWAKKTTEPAIPIANALIMVSLRKVNPSYSGFCVNVIRDSDLSTQNIGFVSGVIDTASLASFCSGTTGRINTWYDQSGNGNNLNGQTTKPIIYQSGNTVDVNGKPSVLFSAHQMALPSTALGTVVYKSVFAVAKMTSLVTINYLTFSFSPKADGLFLGGTFSGVNGFGVVENGIVRVSNSIENLNQNLVTYIGTSPKKVYSNGSNLATEGGTTSDLNFTTVSRSTANLFLNGNLQEILIYSVDNDSIRTTIETDINAFYTIY